jgi:hypothetical protein
MTKAPSVQNKLPNRRFRRLGATLVFAIVLCGLAYLWLNSRYSNWKEEVQLADGRRIVLEQRRDYVHGYGTRKAWLTFSLPEMSGEQTWSEGMQPVLLAVTSDGQVYVAGWPSGEKQMDMYRHPRFGYAAFRWNGKHFERVPFLSIPQDLRKAENVIRCIPNSRFVTWATKMRSSCDERSAYVSGGSREIDLEQMQTWARIQAARQNIQPLSD